MTKLQDRVGMGKIGIALSAAAAIGLALPSAGLALGGAEASGTSLLSSDIVRFTPSTVDPQLAQRVAESIRAKGLDLSFTPAGATAPRDTTITVAVRVDDQTARAISVNTAKSIAQAKVGTGKLAITPTRYNLGIARGYQTFAKTPKSIGAGLATDLQSVDMPDLASFKPSEGTAKDKPSRFKPRIALENNDDLGRAPLTLQGSGEQSVDLGGAYRVTKNLDVTAGVRLSQERDRIAPLTDNVQDSQAVYVGTQFRF